MAALRKVAMKARAAATGIAGPTPIRPRISPAPVMINPTSWANRGWGGVLGLGGRGEPWSDGAEQGAPGVQG